MRRWRLGAGFVKTSIAQSTIEDGTIEIERGWNEVVNGISITPSHSGIVHYRRRLRRKRSHHMQIKQYVGMEAEG